MTPGIFFQCWHPLVPHRYFLSKLFIITVLMFLLLTNYVFQRGKEGILLSLSRQKIQSPTLRLLETQDRGGPFPSLTTPTLPCSKCETEESSNHPNPLPHPKCETEGAICPRSYVPLHHLPSCRTLKMRPSEHGFNVQHPSAIPDFRTPEPLAIGCYVVLHSSL